jgi:hypothetical protein
MPLFTVLFAECTSTDYMLNLLQGAILQYAPNNDHCFDLLFVITKSLLLRRTDWVKK